MAITAEEREKKMEKQNKKCPYIYQAIKKKMVSNLSSLPPTNKRTKIPQDLFLKRTVHYDKTTCNFSG